MSACGIVGCLPDSNAKEPICSIKGCPNCKIPPPCRGCVPKCCNTVLDFPILKRAICPGKCSCCSPWKKHEASLRKRQIAGFYFKRACLCGDCAGRRHTRNKPAREPIPILRCHVPRHANEIYEQVFSSVGSAGSGSGSGCG